MSGIATAIIGGAIVGGAATYFASTGAAETAAEAQTQAADKSVDEQRRQFDKLQSLLAPYVQAGDTALTQQLALAGVSGPEAQQAAIQALEGGPQYQALVKSGEESILQNAAATGGLRGGNVQAALAQYRPQVLSQLIESQYSKLGELTGIGQASAVGVGAAGQNTATAIQQALAASGNAQAQAALAQGAAANQFIGGVTGSIGQVAGMSKETFGKF